MKKVLLALLVTIVRSGRATNSSNCIQFYNVNICGECIIYLSKLVNLSSNLKFLFLEHNWIDDMDLACCPYRSLKSHTCIHTLRLAHCDLG